MEDLTDTDENTSLEDHSNNGLENNLGEGLIGLGAIAVIGSEFSFLILNYSVDVTIGKVILGGLGVMTTGGLLRLHGFWRSLHH